MELTFINDGIFFLIEFNKEIVNDIIFVVYNGW